MVRAPLQALIGEVVPGQLIKLMHNGKEFQDQRTRAIIEQLVEKYSP